MRVTSKTTRLRSYCLILDDCMNAIKILIVEDERIVAHSLRESLQTDGYSVIGIADSALSATRSLQQIQPDLVLLDITLKGETDGITLGQEIQQNFEIPIVYLTAYADTATLARAKTTHPYGYLLKPYRLPEIKIAIEIALNRYRQEQENRQSLQEEARIARRVRQEFLTNIKHEIRTPMNAIQGFCQLLQQEIGDCRYRSYLDSIQESGEELMTTFEAILDLARIESGDLDRPLQPLALRGFLREIEYRFASIARQKNLAWRSRLGSNLPETIRFDEISLKQILAHLVDNALKFTERGTVTIEIESEPVGDERAIGLSISVQDTGIGIPPAARAAIFEAFSQADNSLTRSYGGIGIGLAIVERLTRYLGGTLELESEEGVGSVFRLNFPRVEVITGDAIEDLPPTLPPSPDLSPSSFPPSPVLREQLQILEQEKWLKLVNSVIIGDIRNFARELHQLGTEYDYLTLKTYADILLKQALDLDLDLLKTLEAFPDVVRAVEREFE
jgi:two-component system, sensor histidine kinase